MIPCDRSHLFVAATTHPGMSGKNNEDNYAVSAHQISEKDPTFSVLAIVADGVGGHRAGEVAAEIATETISRIVSESDATNPQQILKHAITKASLSIYNQSKAEDEHRGMGSTCACVWVIGDRLYTASVGDSRIYLLRDGEIRQITTDHTWVQEAIAHGIITPEQGRNHPRAHVIRRYLGSKRPVDPDFRLRLNPNETDEQALANQGTPLKADDILLLCSDGLTDLVDDDEILAAYQSQSLEEANQHLVELANQRGGHDNITIVTLKVPSSPQLAATPTPKTRPKFTWPLVAGISIALVVLSALAAAGYMLLAQRTATPTPAIPGPTMESESLDTTKPALATLTPSLTSSPTPSQTPAPTTETPTSTVSLGPEALLQTATAILPNLPLPSVQGGEINLTPDG